LMLKIVYWIDHISNNSVILCVP